MKNLIYELTCFNYKYYDYRVERTKKKLGAEKSHKR
jgi:hypothetical protein